MGIDFKNEQTSDPNFNVAKVFENGSEKAFGLTAITSRFFNNNFGIRTKPGVSGNYNIKLMNTAFETSSEGLRPVPSLMEQGETDRKTALHLLDGFAHPEHSTWLARKRLYRRLSYESNPYTAEQDIMQFLGAEQDSSTGKFAALEQDFRDMLTLPAADATACSAQPRSVAPAHLDAGAASVQVFPNPAHDQFIIRHGRLEAPLTFRLYDPLGRLAISQMLRTDATVTILQVAQLQAGLYRYQLDNGEHGTLIIQH